MQRRHFYRCIPPQHSASIGAELSGRAVVLLCSWMPRRLLSLVLGFLLLLPAGTLGSVLYVCRMTGNEGPSCCCMAKRAAKAKLAKQAKRPPTIRSKGCCDLKVTAGAERPASTIAPDLQIPPAAVVARLPVELSVAIAPHESLVIAERARGPPPLGAPLYLENCAFLS